MKQDSWVDRLLLSDWLMRALILMLLFWAVVLNLGAMVGVIVLTLRAIK